MSTVKLWVLDFDYSTYLNCQSTWPRTLQYHDKAVRCTAWLDCNWKSKSAKTVPWSDVIRFEWLGHSVFRSFGCVDRFSLLFEIVLIFAGLLSCYVMLLGALCHRKLYSPSTYLFMHVVLFSTIVPHGSSFSYRSWMYRLFSRGCRWCSCCWKRSMIISQGVNLPIAVSCQVLTVQKCFWHVPKSQGVLATDFCYEDASGCLSTLCQMLW